MGEIAKKKIGKKLEPKQSKNRAKTGENKSSARFRSQRGFLCEKGFLLRNHFATLLSPLQKFSQLRNDLLAHECHSAAQEPPFRSCEVLCELLRLKKRHSAALSQRFLSCEGCSAIAKQVFGTRAPFRSTVTSISQLRSELRKRFLNPKRPNLLRSRFSSAKPQMTFHIFITVINTGHLGCESISEKGKNRSDRPFVSSP